MEICDSKVVKITKNVFEGKDSRRESIKVICSQCAQTFVLIMREKRSINYLRIFKSIKELFKKEKERNHINKRRKEENE